IFVGTKIESRKLIESFAKEISALYVNERWIGGTLTNFKTIKNRINYLNDLIKKKETGELEKYTKKEQLQTEKEISKLKFHFQGLQTIEDLPSALVVVDSKKERNAIMEAKKISIPVVAIMNSDCNPDDVDYSIPSNDNSKSSIEYILKELTESYKEGMKTKT
ncbi:30S ribosomal protein S2, partial [Patescibacteria group bacterium]|nr:30S ribosomal protein S2 [Patescibacteria group bacterium]